MGAHGLADRLGDRAQDLIAERMSVDIVDRLEVVEVQGHDRHPAAMAGHPRGLADTRLVKRPLVGQAGQGILAGLALEALDEAGVGDGDRRLRGVAAQGGRVVGQEDGGAGRESDQGPELLVAIGERGGAHRPDGKLRVGGQGLQSGGAGGVVDHHRGGAQRVGLVARPAL